MSAVSERITEIFKEKLDLPADMVIDPTATFEQLKIDSLDLLEVVVAIEMEYDIEISDDQLKEIKDVESAIHCVEGLVKA